MTPSTLRTLLEEDLADLHAAERQIEHALAHLPKRVKPAEVAALQQHLWSVRRDIDAIRQTLTRGDEAVHPADIVEEETPRALELARGRSLGKAARGRSARTLVQLA